jgi:MFS family permease
MARGWWAVSIFAVAAVLSYTDRLILGLLVDPIRHDLGFSDTQISILQGTAFAVLYAVIGLPLGRIADVVPRRALLVFAVLTWSVGTALCGLANSFAALFAARLLVGLGEAALAPAAMSLIGDYFSPERRALPTGVFLTGMVIGGGSAIAIGGFLLNAAQHLAFAAIPMVGRLAPWREVLMVLGLSGTILAALLATVREPRARSVSRAEIRARLLSWDELRHLFGNHGRVLLPLYAAMAIGSIVDFAVLSWTPALLERRFGMSAGEVGLALGLAAAAAGLLGTPLGGFLADRIAARFGLLARIRVCVAVLVLGMAAAPIGIVNSSAVVIGSTFLWIFVSSLAGTIGIATTLDLLAPGSRGIGTATIAFCNMIVGLGLGPTLVALTADHIYATPDAIGPALTTVAAPAIALCCALFFAATWIARKSSPVAAPA